MSTHIEDVEKDDYGLEEWLKKGNITIKKAGYIAMFDDVQLADVILCFFDYVHGDYFRNMELSDPEDFAMVCYYPLRECIKEVWVAHKKGQLQIVGEWLGLRTFVETTSFLQWAQAKGYTIPPDLAPLLQGKKCTAKDDALTLAVPRYSGSQKDMKRRDATAKACETAKGTITGKITNPDFIKLVKATLLNQTKRDGMYHGIQFKEYWDSEDMTPHRLGRGEKP